MKWIRICSAVVATFGATTVAQADLLDLFAGVYSHGSHKSCGCAPACQPVCCQPVIERPCDYTVHTYQRKCSDIKPPCCDTCCAPKVGCAPAPADYAPEPEYDAPACGAPAPSCGHGYGCGCCEVKCCDYDPCEIAELIYQSQTACYADDRESAIDKLGDRFDCVCNPEIMVALVYALNDADEDVREQAADEIGDQLRMNPCCCSKEVIAALKCALADCDRGVRHQAEEALEACGYCIVDGCCEPCGGYCGGYGACGYGDGGAPAPAEGAPPADLPGAEGAPAPPSDGGAAPAPMPPSEPKAYFPSRLHERQSSRTQKSSSGLAKLFGFLR